LSKKIPTDAFILIEDPALRRTLLFLCFTEKSEKKQEKADVDKRREKKRN